MTSLPIRAGRGGAARAGGAGGGDDDDAAGLGEPAGQQRREGQDRRGSVAAGPRRRWPRRGSAPVRRAVRGARTSSGRGARRRQNRAQDAGSASRKPAPRSTILLSAGSCPASAAASRVRHRHEHQVGPGQCGRIRPRPNVRSASPMRFGCTAVAGAPAQDPAGSAGPISRSGWPARRRRSSTARVAARACDRDPCAHLRAPPRLTSVRPLVTPPAARLPISRCSAVPREIMQPNMLGPMTLSR